MRVLYRMILFILVMCIGLFSCNKPSTIQMSFNDIVQGVTIQIVLCENNNKFFSEKLDSLPYKISEYEELYYDCFFPVIRNVGGDSLLTMANKLNLDIDDLSYLIIGLVHSDYNNAKVGDQELLLMAKEFKYQIFRYVMIEKEISKDLKIRKAKKLSLKNGDKVSITFLIDSSRSNDTLLLDGYTLEINSLEDTVTLTGIVDAVFRDVKEHYPIYLSVKVTKAGVDHFILNNEVYGIGSVIPIDILQLGGDIKILQE